MQLSGRHDQFCYSDSDYYGCNSDQSQSNRFQSECSITTPTSLWSHQPSLPSVPSLISPLPSHEQLRQYYLSNIQHRCLTTLKGHTSYVSSVALAGEFLYTGSSDKEIRLWKRNTTNPNSSSGSDQYETTVTNNIVAVGKGAVKSLVVLADKLIFSAHQDNKIRVWKINSDEKHTRLATLPTLSDRATKLLLPKNHVQIRRHKTSTWVHHVDAVSALALSRDETLVYSVSWDRTLKIWRTSDFKCLESITNAHDDAINAVALSKDGDVYTGSTDKKIKVWRKNPGEKRHCLVATLERHKSGINALAISLEGSTLYSGASDRSIVVWEGMTVVGALRGHTKSILCLAVVSELVCSGSADKTIRIWRRGVDRNYTCLAVLEGHKGPVKCLAGVLLDLCNPSHASSYSYSYSHSDSHSHYCVIYSGSMDCDIKVWQVLVPLLIY